PHLCTHRHPHSFPTRRSSDLDGSAIHESTQALVRSDAVSSGLVYRVDARTLRSQRSGAPECQRETAGSNTGEIGCRHGNSSYVPDRKSTRLNSSHVKISYAVF